MQRVSAHGSKPDDDVVSHAVALQAYKLAKVKLLVCIGAEDVLKPRFGETGCDGSAVPSRRQTQHAYTLVPGDKRAQDPRRRVLRAIVDDKHLTGDLPQMDLAQPRRDDRRDVCCLVPRREHDGERAEAVQNRRFAAWSTGHYS